MRRLTRLTRIDGVDVNLHWSTLVICALIVAFSLPNPTNALVLILSFFAILMVHEWGHVIAARRCRCVAWSIEIYPLFGLTRISAPASFYDECVIAWGGVLAQLAVATPLLAGAALFGASSPATKAAVGIFGYFNLIIAILNLIPARGLDGAKAWSIVPMLVGRLLGRYQQHRRQVATPARKKTWIH
jgi:Zn-dependent protease